MPIETIEITNTAAGEDMEITLRGKPERIIQVLIGGLPREALMQVHEALAVEMSKRAANGK